jgi:hypothetical protein
MESCDINASRDDKEGNFGLVFRMSDVMGQYAPAAMLPCRAISSNDLRFSVVMVSQAATFRGKLSFLLGWAKPNS